MDRKGATEKIVEKDCRSKTCLSLKASIKKKWPAFKNFWFQDKNKFDDIKNLDFSLRLDGEVKQEGNTSRMLFEFEEIIAYISKFIMLKKGDIIFTGTPKGVGPITIGNKLEAYIADEKLLEVEIK